MPYRVDLFSIGADAHAGVPDDALDRLVELGALDVEVAVGGGIAALMPESVRPEEIAHALGPLAAGGITVSPAAGRDADSVWVLRPRPVQAGRIRIVPARDDIEPGALRLIDAAAFGTGLHPTTALCLEALDDAVQLTVPDAVLDVGTGSGVLALAALLIGVPRATAVDLDEEALRVAEENARINGLHARLRLARGGPDAVTGAWPLVLANILAAALIDMAPTLVRRLAHRGRLVMSGIPAGLEDEVTQAYRRLGMRRVEIKTRAGWIALVLEASW